MDKPIIGKRCFVQYNDALRECVIIGGAAALRHGEFKRVLAVKIAGMGLRRFGNAEIPDAFLTPEDAKTGTTTPTFEKANVHKVLKETLGGAYTYSTDKPWCVTRYKWNNGKVSAKSFRLPRAVMFTKHGASFFHKPDFEGYDYPTMTQCTSENRVIRFKKTAEKPKTITFSEDDVLI